MPIEPLPTENLQGLRRNSGKKYLTAKPNHITDASRKLDRKSNSLKDYRNFEHFPRTALVYSLRRLKFPKKGLKVPIMRLKVPII